MIDTLTEIRDGLRTSTVSLTRDLLTTLIESWSSEDPIPNISIVSEPTSSDAPESPSIYFDDLRVFPEPKEAS